MPMVPRDFTRNVRDIVADVVADVNAFLGIDPSVPAAFTQQPTVSPLSGTAGQTTFTATSGVLNNGATPTRAWLLGGTVLSTSLSFTPTAQQFGQVTYQEASPDGTATSNAIAVTVNEAAPSDGLQSATTGTAAFRALGISSERQVFPINDLSALAAAGGSGGVADVPLVVQFTSTPAVIQCRSVDYSNNAEVTPWTTVATSPSGSSWTGVFPMREHNGWQKLELRASTSGAASLTTSSRIGAGLLIGMEGQSQARYFVVNVASGGSVTANDNVSAYGRAGLLESGSGGNGGTSTIGVQGWYPQSFNAAVGGITVLGGGGSGAAAMGNSLNGLLNVPVAFVQNAPGGRTIAEINSTSHRPEILARYAEAGRPHYVIMMSHGTGDVGVATSETNYRNSLDTWKAWHEADAVAKPRRKYIMVPLMQQRNSGSSAVIRRAQQTFLSANTADMVYGWSGYDAPMADTVHQNDIGNAIMGRRAHLPIAKDLGIAVTGSLGPVISSVTRSGTTVTATVTFDSGATALATNSAVNGGTTLSAAGFAVLRESDSTVLTTSGAPVLSGNTITLTLSSDPGGPIRVRYGSGNNPGDMVISDNVGVPGQTRGAPLRYDLIGVLSA